MGGRGIYDEPVPAVPDPCNRPIGVFDSGVGGLTVLHELLVALPHEDFVYLADSARFPYGTRTQAELERIGLEVAEELVAQNVKLVVVACNSMTAAALPALRRRMQETTLGVDVIGVVGPEAARAVAVTRNGRIGLLATEATVASGAYARAVAAVDAYVELTAIACPGLAMMIQEPPRGELFTLELETMVRDCCAPLVAAGVDTVILGCTHYPLIQPLIQRIVGPDVTTVTSGAALARQAGHALGSRGFGAGPGRAGDYRFLCTGDVDAFRRDGTRFLQLPIATVAAAAAGGVSAGAVR